MDAVNAGLATPVVTAEVLVDRSALAWPEIVINPEIVISNVSTSNITNSSVAVTWITNRPADSQVEYGISMLYGSRMPLDTTLVTSHLVTLSGLSTSTVYHYRVISTDGAGNSANSDGFMFTTAPAY